MGYSCRVRNRQCVSSLVIVMCVLAQVTELRARPITLPTRRARNHGQHLQENLQEKFLVTQTTVLTYHNGSIMTGTGTPPSLSVYLIWYGTFSDPQRMTILDFFTSTQWSNCTKPSVADWWSITCGYVDTAGVGVPKQLLVQSELNDTACSKGKNLRPADVESIVTESLTTFPADGESIYVLLTADDVLIDDFCNSQCASHDFTAASPATQNQKLAYGWVGNPSTQCPGRCAWPFAEPENGTGPANAALVAPNGDIGIDGMIINLGTILAGMATNPFDDGYYQGDATAPNEAASACLGMFGPGSYPGNAGQLLSDSSTGASFNTYGVNSRKYLLPAVWSPETSTCTPPT